MTKLRSLALVAVASSSVGLAACGGTGDSSSAGNAASSSDAQTLLVSTFKPSEDGSKIKSGAIEITLSGKMTGATAFDGSASAKIAIDEGKDGELPDFKADVAVDAKQKSGQNFKLNAGGTYTGGRFYVSYDGENYDVGEEISRRAVTSMKQAVKQSGSGDQQQLIGKLGLNPETWLIDPKVEGDEQIGGVDTYKISGSVDIKKLVPDVLQAARKAQSLTGTNAATRKVPTITDAQLSEVAKQMKQVDVTMWTGKDDKILRQLKVDLKLNDAKGNDALSGSLQLTLTGVNEPQKISAPSDTKPITELMPKLGGLFTAASGLTGAASSGSGSMGSSAGSTAVSEAYVQCVNAAGTDPAKLNDCQSTLAK
jgi:hypothetical protein